MKALTHYLQLELFHSQGSHTHRARRNQVQHQCSLAQEGGCLLLLNVFLFFGCPEWLWPSPCCLLFSHKGEILLSLGPKDSSPTMGSVTSATRAVSLQPVQHPRLGWRHGDAWARQAANDYCSCYFKPLVYNQNVFLPKIQSRSAARLLILTQVPPVSQVWSSLATWPVGSGTPQTQHELSQRHVPEMTVMIVTPT